MRGRSSRALTTVVRALQRKKLQDENKRLELSRQRAETALRESEKKYRQLVENANDLIFTMDLNGKFTSGNKATEDIVGYQLDELLGFHFSKVVPPEYMQIAQEMIQGKIEGRSAATKYELEALTKDGRRVPVEINSSLIFSGGKPAGIQGILRDITERKRMEEGLRKAKEQADEATKLKDKFVSLVSHDLRSPIATVSGWGDTPIMMVMHDNDGDAREKMFSMGFHVCVLRPIKWEELVPRVRRFIF